MNKRIFSYIIMILSVLMTVMTVSGIMTPGTVYAASDSDITIETLRVTLRSGAVKNEAGDYVWTADHSYADHRFTFRVSYAISGTYEHAPESVRIVIPKKILVNRNGVLSDYYEMSLPREDAEGMTDGNLYVYKEEGENLVIYNRREVAAAQNGYFEISYLTSERTFEYADYGASGTKNPKGGSDSFKASMTVVQDNIVKTKDSEKIPVYINTTARITSTSKAYPTFYSSWQSSWGSQPSDSNKWYYLVWEIRTYISNPTQPYNFSLEDNFSPDGEVLAYRFAGTSTYTTNNTVTNQRGSSAYGRYDYVLTRIDKAEHDRKIEANEKYTYTNNVTAFVDPIDQVDADTNAKAVRTWTYVEPKKERPKGHFYMYKYGLDYKNAYVRNSEDIRRFDLDEFINPNNDVNQIDDLAYYTYVHGYPWPWTRDADDPDSYGKNPVTWVLTDNNFNMKAIDGQFLGEGQGTDSSDDPGETPHKTQLTAEDYQIDSIRLDFSASEASYDAESMKVTSIPVVYADNEAVIVSAEYGGSNEFSEVARWYPKTRTWTINDNTKVSGTDGMTLYFQNSDNDENKCTGYKLVTTNSHYYTRMGAYPYITLLGSTTVRDITNNLNEPKIAVRNIANSNIYQGTEEGKNRITSFTKTGTDYVIGIIRHGNIKKSVTGYANSVVKREYTVTWTVNADESYLDEGHTRVPVTQESGIFYDLMPKGANYKVGSLVAYADGKRLSPGKYEIETFANYNDSGRTLLKVSFNQIADKYAFTFSTLHSWDMIQAYGEQLLNSVAYETGNADIGDGRPDDGGTGTDKVLLRDLDPATDAEKFIYAQANHNIHVLHAASLGLYKKVLAAQDSDYSYETTTYQDSDYSYALHFATDSHTKASNLMLFDSLENYVVAAGENAGASSDWHGKLTGIDVSEPQSLGIVPVVYYSTKENLAIDKLGISENYDFPARIWTKAEDFGEDLSSVKAVAVDLRYGIGGKVFELKPDTPVLVRLFMRSPEKVTSDKLDPIAYNNIWLYDTHANVDTGASETELIHQDFTRLHYRVVADLPLSKMDSTDFDVKVENIVFRLSGISDYGTEIDEYRTTDHHGYLCFENIERGSYILQEVDGVRDYLQDHSERSVIIDPDGTVTLDGNLVTEAVEIPNDPRIHGELSFEKLGTVDGHQGTKSLEGAVFLIEGTSDYGNEIELYAVSDASGRVTFEDVELGSYEMTELEAPEGYILSQKSWRVVCDETKFVYLYEIDENGNVMEPALNELEDAVLINEPLHKLLLKKYDAANTTIFLPGVEFRLTGTSDYGSMVDLTVRTDEFGTAHFEGLEPGNYVLRETEAPDHYEPDEKERLVTVRSDGSVTVEGLELLTGDYAGYVGFPNERKYEGVVTITKQWNDNNAANRPIPVVHLDTEEKTFAGPTATIDKEKWMANVNNDGGMDDYSMPMRNAVSFTRNTSLNLEEVKKLDGAKKIDDDTTDRSIYFWTESKEVTNEQGETAEELHAYWWSDAEIVFFPEDSSKMFLLARKLTELDLEDFNTSKVTNMQALFDYCTELRILKISTWDTSNVKNMRMIFYYCRSLENLNLTTWVTSSVEDLSLAFERVISLDVSNWDVAKVKTLEYTFSHTGDRSNPLHLDLHTWKTDSLTNMYNTFAYSYFSDVDLSNWNVSNVTNMQGLFFDTNITTKLDTTGWDTSKVKNVYAAFASARFGVSGDQEFEWIGGNNWDLSSVTSVNEMFRSCSIKKLDLSKWNVSNLKSLSGMFKGIYFATGIQELDLSGWDISKVTDLTNTFGHLSGIRRIYVGDGWKTDQITRSTGNFVCTEWTCSKNSLVNLQGEKGTTWSASNATDKTYARVDDPENGKPGYFWYKNTPIVTGHALTLSDIAETASEEKAIMPAVSEIPQILPKEGEDQNETIAIHQVTHSSLWNPSAGDDDPTKVFDQWVDNGDGTWTYRFRVFDQDSEYHVWEDTTSVPGYSWVDAEGNWITTSIPLNYLQGGSQNPDPLIIINKKDTDEPNPGYGGLSVSKQVTGSVPSSDHGREFTLNVTLTGASGHFGAYDFTDGQPTAITIRDGETVMLSGIPERTFYTIEEEVPQGYSVEYTKNGLDIFGYVEGNIVTGTVAVVDITNEAQYGRLTLKKTLSAAPGAELTDADRARKFAFEITLDDQTFSGVHGGLVFTDGKATAWLSGDEELTVEGLPLNLGYTVSEQIQAGFEITKQEGTTGTISGNRAEASINNEKQPHETGGLKLIKTAPENHDDNFTFHLHFSGLQNYTEYDYTLNGVPAAFNADAAGIAYLSLALANGQSAEFKELPKDAKVTVAEDANQYIASYSINGAPEVYNRVPDRTLSTESLTITADQTLLVSFNNISQEFTVAFRKLDDDGAYLEGAELSVLDEVSGQEIARWISESEEKSIALPAGTYILREMIAPDGYQYAEDVHFAVSRSGIVTVDGVEEDFVYFVDIVNTPLPVYELTLAKETGGRYGSSDRYFTFTVSLSALPDGLYAIDLTNAERSIRPTQFDSRPHGNPETLVVAGGSGSAELRLKHGQQIKIGGLPQNTTVSISEDAVDYTASWKLTDGKAGKGASTGELVINGDIAVTFTNILDQEPLSISGSKTWDDNDNQDGHRPESITIRLHANGADTGKFVILSNASGWTWTFSNLDRTADGKPIDYTITEDAASDYTAIYSVERDGFHVTNRYTPGKTSLTVEKAWNDHQNQDGIRPESVTVKLLADGRETGKTCILEESNHWECVFGELDEKANGQTISYSVKEDPVPDGYDTDIEGNAVTGYVIINSHEPEKTRISGIKVWDDNTNRAGLRPAFITIRLHADGAHNGQFVTVSSAGDRAWSFEDLDKYINGREIVYTVTEDAVDNYQTDIDEETFTITNRYTPGKTSLSAEKQWLDEEDKDGIRPESIRVILYADGVAIETAELNEAGHWFHEFTDLEEYVDGRRIVYTVGEMMTDVITGTDGEGTYAFEILGDEHRGFTIVNLHTPVEETPEPPTPTPELPHFFRIDEELPKTGLTVAQSVKPESVKYQRIGMELMIPSLDVTAQIVSVDHEDGGYPVEWLGMDAGLLDGSALPGEGISVIAAHNTINKEEYGPFALLAKLQPGDRFFVRKGETLKSFTVYANEKIGAADTAALERIASRHEKSLTLLTCEDERQEGGYASRRIVAAIEDVR